MFLTVYYSEIFLNITARGWQALYKNVIIFDIFLALDGTLGLIIFEMSYDVHPMLRALVLLRVLRIYKYIKTTKFLSGLWLQLCSLASSVSTLLSTVVLLGIILYIFGCFAIELMSKDPFLREQEDTRQ